MNEQEKTPFLDALKKYVSENVSPFDVPGHHMGNVDNDFKSYVGQMLYTVDVNAPRGLDNLNHPSGVLAQAQDLMAKAYHADEAFFLINGTSSGNIAMILATVSTGEKIILPRNCHKSVINALILSGAIPVFIMPQFDHNLEIANQPTYEDYEKAILENPDAKAIFVINPTYFGACQDIKKLCDLAHEHNMVALADEAHGAHFGFYENLPMSAMQAGFDVSASSIHKTAGALTQASVLLRKGNRVNHYEIFKALATINSTSPSTILMASLDSARKYMAINGHDAEKKACEIAKYTREEINKIPGFKARGKEYFMTKGAHDYDSTKVVIELEDVDINGFDIYNILKDDYEVQMELAEQYVLLAIIAIGTKKEHVDHLINALKDISLKHYRKHDGYPQYHYDEPYTHAVMSPRDAYQAPLKKVSIDECIGLISKESIMAYPPGIPLIIPGEVFTKSIIERIEFYKQTGATVLMDFDDGMVSTVDYQKLINERGKFDGHIE